MRFNMNPKEIQDYIYNIYKRIEALNPVVIYLKNSDIKQRIQEVSKERDVNVNIFLYKNWKIIMYNN